LLYMNNLNSCEFEKLYTNTFQYYEKTIFLMKEEIKVNL